MKNTYFVNIGNIGMISCINKKEAEKCFNEYVRQSKSDYGRAAGEDVCLLVNYELIKEYFGTLNQED